MNPQVLDDSDLQALTDSTLRRAVEQHAQGIPLMNGCAVALSAGPDSAMLAVHVAHWARQRDCALYFFHIHHGLQKPADGWARQAQQLGRLLGVPVWVKKVVVEPRGDGIESAARRARYEGLQEMARTLGVKTIFLGHHLDDQAETVLMRLLRGSGPTGLQAMSTRREAGALQLLRPFLEIGREHIMKAAKTFSAQTCWHPVTDPTNLNPVYRRGVIREALAPVLNEHWPQWRQVLNRHAHLAAEEATLLDEWAAEILSGLDADPQTCSFCLLKWRALSPAKQRLVLRHFFQQAGLPMPSQARLAEMQRQLQTVHQAGTDRQLQIQHAQHALRCLRGRVLLQPYDGVNKNKGKP